MSSRPTKAVRAPVAANPTSPIECHVDALDGLKIHGWAYDPEDQRMPAVLHVIVDDQQTETIICDRVRPDVGATGRGNGRVGFEVTLPVSMADGVSHSLSLRDVRRRQVDLVFDGQVHEHLTVLIELKPVVASHIDGLKQGSIEGWVMRTDLGDTRPKGDCMIRVTCEDLTIGHVRASRSRADVGRALNGPSNCGFRFQIPSLVRSAKARKFQLFLMPENIELDGSPFTTSVVEDDGEGRFLELVASVDAAHRELTRIRRQLRAMVPEPRYSIADYDGWFLLYEPALRLQVKAGAPPDGWQPGPLVSVVCPVYRPDLQEFRTAVESVLKQTYSNIELILVDDNSRRPELSQYMAEVANADERVKVLVHKKNLGISHATNTALASARGEWVAFFDHDDVLVDVAIECMVNAARTNGGRILYSDEDKLNADGSLTSPAFKPDWNHRLLLGVNYVCHLLFVERALLDEVGPLNPAYDGAQDHDLILRLSEHVDPSQIQHVPEVLYHWRITEGSTAQSGGNKSYATAAGEAAVSDHLARLGLSGTVESISGDTFYRVNWSLVREPEVTIIIPYKDQIKITEQCLVAVLENTNYRHFKVLLVDNWSTSQEAARFKAKYSKNKKVSFLRIEESFNYSRLNNIAVSQSKSEYYMFMNNDLIVRDKNWLRVLVGEAEADPSVGAVGGKFFYPDGSLQHGGVVLGMGGVAGHSHTGVQAHDPGYAARLLFAQQMSAVTAAGMLVRAKAFEAAGGFDEKMLKVAFNDIDLCLKLGAAGYKIMWTPEFTADHHESLSRGDDERPVQEGRFFDEMETMKERWGETLTSDPFYHPKFSLEHEAFFDLRNPEARGGA